MEGSLFITPDRGTRVPGLVCADCGAQFRPRRVIDGVEEICDACYSARFPSPYIKHSQLPQRPGSSHLAAD